MIHLVIFYVSIQLYFMAAKFAATLKSEKIYYRTLPNTSRNGLNAVLLAGGYGTRARPFTYHIPKAMIPIDGKPSIDYIVRYLAKFSQVSGLFIICEFDGFGKQIINYFEGKKSIIGKPLTFIEDKKNGTGGALITIEKYVGEDGCFLVWFADNLCALRINNLYTSMTR